MSVVTKESNPELYNALFPENEIKEMNLSEMLFNRDERLLDCITNLQEIRKEHSIMKQFIYENGLWEKFLNDDRFLKHLRSDNNE